MVTSVLCECRLPKRRTPHYALTVAVPQRTDVLRINLSYFFYCNKHYHEQNLHLQQRCTTNYRQKRKTLSRCHQKNQSLQSQTQTPTHHHR